MLKTENAMWEAMFKLHVERQKESHLEKLGHLAMQFRRTRDLDERLEIAKEYAKVWEQAKSFGESPPPEDQLPHNFMPKDWWK